MKVTYIDKNGFEVEFTAPKRFSISDVKNFVEKKQGKNIKVEKEFSL